MIEELMGQMRLTVAYLLCSPSTEEARSLYLMLRLPPYSWKEAMILEVQKVTPNPKNKAMMPGAQPAGHSPPC